MIKDIIRILILISVILLPNIYSQSLEDLKKKITESGLSEEEIKKRAEEAGYTLEDYLKLQEAIGKKEEAIKSASEQSKVIVVPPSKESNISYSVPEFSNREGAESLQAFGYNIFNYSPTTFEPSLNVPVPKNYTIGPGDEIIITLWGETQLVHNVTVSKNGDIFIPNIGLIPVNGLTLKELKAKIFQEASKVYASLKSDGVEAKTKLDVSTGKLRSVKIYVLGEVSKPGGYTLPSLSTSFTALYYCGGPTINGTLRNVQVIRNGKIISIIDVYDYLITGTKKNDIRLEDEDIIFVPPVGKRVAISGNAFRPAIYELKENEKLNDLLKYAGGIKFTAYYDRVHVERIIPFSERKSYKYNILSIDLKFQSLDELLKSNFSLENGDVVNILGINKLPENRVVISGFVKKPGVYELKTGMTIKNLILKADSLLDQAFLEKGLLIRTLPSEKKEIFNFNVRLALLGDKENNFVLKNRDEVKIFEQLNFYPSRMVEISGEVKNPGAYPRYENMTLTELIIMAGGLTDKASIQNIEVTRLDTTNLNIYSQKFLVNLPLKYWEINTNEDFILRDYDRILVKADPLKEFSKVVSISGEVLYPGTYTILYENEKLFNLIKRAGGLKPSAYTKGMYIERDKKLLEKSFIPIPDSLLFRNKKVSVYNPNLITEYTKRIPIEWNEILKDTNSVYNVILQPGDLIVIPKDPQTISVVGDVIVPSSVPYSPGKKIDYYIKQAGGYKLTAAKGDEIVILPNGKKWEPSGFFLTPDPPIESGSTIIVPTLVEYRNSTTWSYVRDIFTMLSSSAVVILTVLNLIK